MADNFHVTVRADMGALESALRLACASCFKIIGYKSVVGTTGTYDRYTPRDVKDDTPRLILFLADAKNVVPFPAPMKPEELTPLIKAWLRGAEYGPEPDHAGENSKGFYLTTGNDRNHIADMGYESCLDIRPCWMMYEK